MRRDTIFYQLFAQSPAPEIWSATARCKCRIDGFVGSEIGRSWRGLIGFLRACRFDWLVKSQSVEETLRERI
jgi:hypothetical protein